MLSGAAPWVLARTLVTKPPKDFLNLRLNIFQVDPYEFRQLSVEYTPSNLPTIDFLTEVLQILFVCPYMWIAPLLLRC
jgi:hypothetical protein